MASQIREAAGLYHLHSRDVAQRVATRLDEMNAVSEIVAVTLGAPLSGRRVLDIGVGQGLFHMAYLGRQNDVTGIDLEVIAQGADLPAYVRMWRINGPRRTTKTVGRKTSA